MTSGAQRRLIVDGITGALPCAAPDTPAAAQDEHYDLIVAGAGIAGLSAAYFWLREVDPSARVLLIDPAAEFGGQATRNEYAVDGHRLIAAGGSQAMTRPGTYPDSARELLRELGIDPMRFHREYDGGHYRRHGAGGLGVFFHREFWDHDHLAVLRPGTKWSDAFAGAPMPPEARRQLGELLDRCPDWLHGLGREAKLAVLRERTCAQVLTEFADLHPDVHRYLSRSTAVDSGMNFDQHPALDAALIGYPGLSGLRIGYEGDPWPGLSQTGRQFWYSEEAPIYRFPDGNATLARALGRALIPDLAPAGGVEELLTAELDRAQLDRAEHQVRIRLHSSVIQVRHTDERTVSVTYQGDGGPHRVTAGAVVLACWGTSLPGIVPELSAEQRAAAAGSGRYPLAYANLALRNWLPWQRLAISRLELPSGHWQRGALAFPVRIGAHSPSPDPTKPVVANFFGCFTAPGMSPKAGAEQGRRWLREHPGELEASLLSTMDRIFGPAGFVAERDVAALTISSWPNGYARYLTLPHDRDRWPQGPAPGELLARGVGRIRVAGVDVANHPYLDGAVATAHNAVRELAEVAGPGRR